MHLIFDTETTGLPPKGATPLDPRQPHILELAAILLDDSFNEVQSYVSLVCPPAGVVCDPGSFRAHGISCERARAQGAPLPEVLQTFAALLSKAQYLWGFNVAFDIQMLTFNCLRAHQPAAHLKVRTFCAMQLMTPHCKIPAPWGRGEFKWPKLQAAHVHAFGHEFDGAHSALADVRATGRLLKWLSAQDNWPLKGERPSAQPREAGVRAGRVLGSEEMATATPSVAANTRAATTSITIEPPGRPTFHIPIAHVQTR